MPEWERRLWWDVFAARDRERSEGNNETREPGDWIPYGRCPYELIPEPDTGPLTLPQYVEPGHPRGDRSGDSLRRWHKLRKAGLR